MLDHDRKKQNHNNPENREGLSLGYDAKSAVITNLIHMAACTVLFILLFT